MCSLRTNLLCFFHDFSPLVHRTRSAYKLGFSTPFNNLNMFPFRPLQLAYTGIQTAQIIIVLLNMPLYVIFATYLAWVALSAGSLSQLTCSFPYASNFLTSCRPPPPFESQLGVDYQQALQVEFDGLDSLLSSGVEAMSLSQHMMQARFSLDDLIVVVQASTLGSRDTLSEELLKINMEAKDIAVNLQRFMHGVQSTADL